MRAPSFFNVVVLATLLLVSQLSLARTFRDSETCATSAVEVSRSLEISKAVDGFGGLSDMLGGWRLAGFAGIFAKTHVVLVSEATSFTVKINDDDQKKIVFCVDQASPDILRLHVQKSKDPEFSLFLLKPGQAGQTVYGACSKSKWKFMKFKRL